VAVEGARFAYDAWHREHPTGDGPWYDLVKAALGSGLLDGARVLEIGCGGGVFAAWMAENGAGDVVAQDFSVTPIAEAERRFHHDNLTFSVGDIEAIDAPAESFDLAVSCETIEHVPDPAKAVAELARVLRPGGTLLLTTPNYMSLIGVQRMYWKVKGRKWDEGGQPIAHLTVLPRTMLWCRRSGLTIERITGAVWDLPVPGRQPYPLTPPERYRKLFVPVAMHQLIEARRPAR
jgi:2-polyprenyl-3-methyl-5-hydroxy-6-metoxy-1,4-benzoquinol methylase